MADRSVTTLGILSDRIGVELFLCCSQVVRDAIEVAFVSS
jgi:hypothetical protein